MLTHAMSRAGLVHYQQNLDCYTATYTISYNSEDPGTQVHQDCSSSAILCCSHDADYCAPS